MGRVIKILIAIVAANALSCGLIYCYKYDFWEVPNDDPRLLASIGPAFRPGDLLMIAREPSFELESMVRCLDPKHPGHWLVGRILGRANDTVAFRGEKVSLNGIPIPYSEACPTPKGPVKDLASGRIVPSRCEVQSFGARPYSVLLPQEQKDDTSEHLVQSGKIYVVSDNRVLHVDSREVGEFDERMCQSIFFRLKQGPKAEE